MNNRIIDIILSYAEDYNLFKGDNEITRANKYRHKLKGAIKIVGAIGGLVTFITSNGIYEEVHITLDGITYHYKYDDCEFIST